MHRQYHKSILTSPDKLSRSEFSSFCLAFSSSEVVILGFDGSVEGKEPIITGVLPYLWIGSKAC